MKQEISFTYSLKKGHLSLSHFPVVYLGMAEAELLVATSVADRQQRTEGLTIPKVIEMILGCFLVGDKQWSFEIERDLVCRETELFGSLPLLKRVKDAT